MRHGPYVAELVNTAAVARVIKSSDRNIRDLAKNGVLTYVKQKGAYRFNLLQAVGEYCEYLRGLAFKRQATDEELDKQKLIAEIGIKEAKREKSELELSEMKLSLLSVDDVEAIMTDHVYMVRAALLALPSRLSVDLSHISDANAISARLRGEVESMLLDFADHRFNKGKFEKMMRDRKGLNDAKKDDTA
jgi:phage terminase Nu1 subunit (DNA packaging protein)